MVLEINCTLILYNFMSIASFFVVIFRSFVTFLSGVDVPILYSPVPFQNAALSAPEVGVTNVI